LRTVLCPAEGAAINATAETAATKNSLEFDIPLLPSVASHIRIIGRSYVIVKRFLTDLTGEGLDMICVDGGSGLGAALPTVLPGIPVQRCWAHKIRNILDKIKKTDQPAAKRAIHSVIGS
jgi:hypothetical protein